MDFARRAARNEELIREVNEQIEEGAKLHEVSSSMPLHCECAEAMCLEKIEVAPQTYEPILQERYRFIVIPAHVQPEIERWSRSTRASLLSRRPARRANRSTPITRNSATAANPETHAHRSAFEARRARTQAPLPLRREGADQVRARRAPLAWPIRD
jgi:hypothetical protein